MGGLSRPTGKLDTMLYLRSRFHPLFYLRRFSVFQWATRLLDVPIAIRFSEVSHPVYVSFSKNLGWVLSGGSSAEEGERENFIWLIKTAGFRCFLDVGANVGLYAFIFGSLTSDGTVTMIEPDDSNARLIRKTILASKLRCTLVEAAVSDESGGLTFYKDDLTGSTGSLVRAADDSFIAVHHHQNPLAVNVKSVTLDELCSIDLPDFIKIDVEGAEIKVLRGGESVLAQSHPALMFECDQDQEAVTALLHSHDYLLFDMESLTPAEAVMHNTLALHRFNHAGVIDSIRGRSAAFPAGRAPAA
jgi:FkbM family methyltransferase